MSERKTKRVLARAGLILPIPAGVCVGGKPSRCFPTEGDGVEVYADHPFVRRALRVPDLGKGRDPKAPKPQSDLVEVKSRPAAEEEGPNVEASPASSAASSKLATSLKPAKGAKE